MKKWFEVDAVGTLLFVVACCIFAVPFAVLIALGSVEAYRSISLSLGGIREPTEYERMAIREKCLADKPVQYGLDAYCRELSQKPVKRDFRAPTH